MRWVLNRLLPVCVLVVASCAPCDSPVAAPTLEYLGQARLAQHTVFEGTVVGGLSGISYDAGRDCFDVISDDRSAAGPARFYTVRLELSERGVGGVHISGVHPLLDDGGRPFAALNVDASPPVVPPDPEGIAFDGTRNRLYWTSEGERHGTVLADPWIRIAGLDGGYLGRFDIPPQLVMSAERTGPRRNRTLEGLSVTADGRMLFAAMEGPGYDDGPVPDQAHGALTRITAYGLDSANRWATPVAQYAYPLDPAPADTEPGQTNGLTDLVALSDTEFLVIERAFSLRPTVRLFRAGIGSDPAATDVLGVPALKGAQVVPMTKTLLVDLSAVPGLDLVDNIEGITLGPRLPDGRQTLVLVSDDNFSPRQVTQFVVFAIPARGD